MKTNPPGRMCYVGIGRDPGPGLRQWKEGRFLESDGLAPVQPTTLQVTEKYKVCMLSGLF
jgi:hypothetical protein